MSTSTELSVRDKTDQVIATLNLPAVVEQIAESLPENVSLDRFKRITITAIRSNAKLVDADQTSLFASIVRCAQDGLYPDGREAALVIFKGKVAYMPMIAGLRKVAAEYGWLIRTAVVYENDDFDYELGLDDKLVHHPARPGVERGDRIFAYAIGVHRSGRKEFVVMNAEEVEKVRQVSRAKDDGPWVDWPERMWEKSAGRQLFKKLSLDPNDARLARILEEAQLAPAAAAELLYGPDGTAFLAKPAEQPTDAPVPSDGAGREEHRQAGAPALSPPAGAPVPGDDDEPEPGPAPDASADTKIPNGNYEGMTLAEVAAAGDEGETWLWFALRHESKYEPEFFAALVAFVRSTKPELHARYDEWRTQREAA